MALLELDLYMPAFAVLRSSLEHQVQDHLLFLGHRYLSIVEEVSDETLAEWQQAIVEGREDFAGVLEVRRAKGSKVEVIRSGPHFTPGAKGPGAPGLSMPPREEARFGFARAAETWRTYLVWRQLKANLLLNEFYSEVELARWDVHFSFLSTFTHPTQRGLNIVYGRNLPRLQTYDHFASELVLLYLVTIAHLELVAFGEMARREPTVEVVGWDRISLDLERASLAASHLWFPRGAPHPYDSVQEANHRGLDENHRPLPLGERPRPDEIPEDEVLYYSNPLRRIIKMHASVNEWTDFPYVSPWPRPDAMARSMD